MHNHLQVRMQGARELIQRINDLNRTIKPDEQAQYREAQQKKMQSLKFEAGQLRRQAMDVIKQAAQKILDQAEVCGNLALELQRPRRMLCGH